VTGKARRKALQEYLFEIRDLCRLQVWDIEVIEQPSPDAALDTHPDPRLHWARVRVGTFFDQNENTINDPEEQRKIAIHEILHLPQGPLLHWLENGAWAADLSPGQAQHIRERVTEETEVVTELYARMLAPLMPLPPVWPDDDA
jgi:hypothetical protein